ncbi:hypothetical protein [Burkholderia vietnamiensis]|uniref:hypothetical protein n=1 Tax=Burkholderia vietnamiensis TaxID=60552 RepID=UPI000B065C02|nr:hypothetical protein [Burkholderia vietnamiensis]
MEQVDGLSSDEISKLVLEGLGLRVEKLEEPGDRQKADFLAHYEDEVFLIEAKVRSDDKKELKKREVVLSQGAVSVLRKRI